MAKEGIVDFSFKINGHRHIFQATTMRERDGWFLAIDKAVADAKAKREDILSSDGYKETIGKLGKHIVFPSLVGLLHVFINTKKCVAPLSTPHR